MLAEKLELVNADLDDRFHTRAIVSLLEHYAKDPAGGGNGLSDFVRKNLINELKKQKSCAIFLAFVAGEAAGMAICFQGFSTFSCQPLINIHDFVVSNQYRGQGLANKLLSQVEEYARQIHCCKITLEVLDQNQSALKAYERFGFNSYTLKPEMGKAIFLEKKLVS